MIFGLCIQKGFFYEREFFVYHEDIIFPNLFLVKKRSFFGSNFNAMLSFINLSLEFTT
jgi:hypothetical protein